jgi:predicted metal-dependent HD superfamily phosphohydrolase
MDSALEQLFRETAGAYCANRATVDNEWTSIAKHYESARRFYHTFEHLHDLSNKLNQIKGLIEDWDATVFALFYHDIIYNIVKKNNEQRSGLAAVKALNNFGFPLSRTHRVQAHINATAKHELTMDQDTNFFTDADLAILGAAPKKYTQYRIHIRKEYWLYPDIVYNAGRRKVIEHFLTMKKIFKTDHFQQLEEQARLNLQQELLVLGN